MPLTRSRAASSVTFTPGGTVSAVNVQAAIEEVASEAGGGGGGGGGLQEATVTLSSADILDLHNTPILLLASPGPGRFIAPIWFTSDTGAGTTGYANGSYSGVVVSWGEGDVWAVEDLGALTTTSGISHQFKPPKSDTRTIGSIADKAMHVYIDDAFTDGDFSLTVRMGYTVHDVPA